MLGRRTFVQAPGPRAHEVLGSPDLRASARPPHEVLGDQRTSEESRIPPTTATVVRRTFARAHELDLGGSIHHALVAESALSAIPVS